MLFTHGAGHVESTRIGAMGNLRPCAFGLSSYQPKTDWSKPGP